MTECAPIGYSKKGRNLVSTPLHPLARGVWIKLTPDAVLMPLVQQSPQVSTDKA